ncbi:hypothetical protein LTR78_009297 [Recurvomyces mirabilis]|uniref:CCHC-type domain-containing protein n=1 Tax=Recurvomyces mirabilis TaxID=574656 RepID=A0AAE0WIQ1_9PEZI|nr:hypothetical protein LTR78_009297 [Recurvomyces mirabilis]KAK5156142.1 hypothetical protein LTS14_005029 [Recurvomyces mirabilis]
MSSHPHPPSKEAETERRHRAGLCFYCGQTGHGFKSCPSRLELLAKTAEHRRVLELKEYDEGPNREPVGKRVRFDTTDSSNQRHDSVVDENDLLHHYNLLQHEPDDVLATSTAVIRKKPLLKRQALAQYLPGFSYPGGPGRLVHGTKMALRELRLAVTLEMDCLVSALETSTKHLAAKAEFPTNFLARVRNLHINEDTTTLSPLECDRVMLFDFRQVMAVLKAAGRCMVTVGNFETFVYRLGIVTCSGSGPSTMRRAQVIEEETTECLKSFRKRTIWLYTRVDEYGDEVRVSWFGFKQNCGGYRS